MHRLLRKFPHVLRRGRGEEGGGGGEEAEQGKILIKSRSEDPQPHYNTETAALTESIPARAVYTAVQVVCPYPCPDSFRFLFSKAFLQIASFTDPYY